MYKEYCHERIHKPIDLYDAFNELDMKLASLKAIVGLMIANERVDHENEQQIPISTLMDTGYLLDNYLTEIDKCVRAAWKGYRDLKKD